jgi:hypothetical protein
MTQPLAIATDETSLYFGTATELQMVSKSGGTVVTLDSESWVGGIAVTESAIYWTTPDSIKKLAR